MRRKPRPEPFGKRRYTPVQREAAKGKITQLKEARGILQPVLVELHGSNKEKKAVFKILLMQKRIKTSLSDLVAQSLFLSENLRQVQAGQYPKREISALKEGFLMVKMDAAVRAVKDARKRGILEEKAKEEEI